VKSGKASTRVHVVLAVGASAVAGAVMLTFLGGAVNAYAPTPEPTATATPSPTPSPSPTPTIEPALLPPPNGVTNPPNPPRRVEVSPGIVVVSRATVLRTPARYYVFPATRSPRTAPRADRWRNGRWVPVYTVRQVIRLVATVPPNQTFRVFMQRPGESINFGTAVSTPDGKMSLPGLRVRNADVYNIALVNTLTGITFYLKISVGPR
jgi:hypothetical protein